MLANAASQMRYDELCALGSGVAKYYVSSLGEMALQYAAWEPPFHSKRRDVADEALGMTDRLEDSATKVAQTTQCWPFAGLMEKGKPV